MTVPLSGRCGWTAPPRSQVCQCVCAIVHYVPHVLRSVIALLLILLAAPATAPSILAIRQGARILLAADSLRIGTTDGSDRVPLRVCKIKNYGSIVYTAAGRYQPPAIAPDAIAANLLPRYLSEPIRDRVARFVEAAKTSFESYNPRVPSDQIIFTYVIGFFEAGEPVLLTQRFLSVGGRLDVQVQREIEDNALLPAGQSGFLNHEQLVGRTFQAEEYPAMLDEIIRLQARLTPDIVGEPVDIIQLTTKGAEWLQVKQGCRRTIAE